MQGSLRQLAPEEFPALLSEIPQPPKQLYLRGSLPPEGHKLLAVVGSRKYTPYGKSACETLIAGLAGHPISIISGLALGIDSIAHRAALSAGLHTLAVPGSGLDESVLYPVSHRPLARDIIESGGGLLSEYEPKFKATPYSFPERNRLMVGMSHAVLMIEGAERSGTLVTARLAGEYNRELLAVPGPIFSANSFGPHLFIRLGATPIRNADDILEALGLTTAREPRALPDDLSQNEQLVLSLIAEPIARDALIAALKLPIQEIHILLATMELKGLLREELGFLRSACTPR